MSRNRINTLGGFWQHSHGQVSGPQRYRQTSFTLLQISLIPSASPCPDNAELDTAIASAPTSARALAQCYQLDCQNRAVRRVLENRELSLANHLKARCVTRVTACPARHGTSFIIETAI